MGHKMEEMKWVTVTETNGITVAEMFAERLKAAEIPAVAIQESSGKSFGFSVGPLSAAYVRVPTNYLEEARLLLDVDAKVDKDDIVICPECESEIELDKADWKQGWFDCPVCTERITLEDLF